MLGGGRCHEATPLPGTELGAFGRESLGHAPFLLLLLPLVSPRRGAGRAALLRALIGRRFAAEDVDHLGAGLQTFPTPKSGGFHPQNRIATKNPNCAPATSHCSPKPHGSEPPPQPPRLPRSQNPTEPQTFALHPKILPHKNPHCMPKIPPFNPKPFAH